MESFEASMQSACSRDEIAGAVLVATGKNGDFCYEKAFGGAFHEDGTKAEPYSPDAVFWYASSTKLITSIAAMQCVERGLLDLDADVTAILPELKGAEILSGFDEGSGTPTLKRATGTITLRHLLSHSSGLGYDIYQPHLVRWRQWRGEPVALTGLSLIDRSTTPLLFEPGSDWEYATGIDWAGEMVRRVNGNVKLQEYLEMKIWKPLGIRDMTFHLDQRPDLRARLSPVTRRSEDTGTLSWATHPISYGDPVEDQFGGGGLYGTAPEYLKVLRSLCFNDGKLLQPKSLEVFFAPQLSLEAHTKLNRRLEDQRARRSLGGGTPLGVEVDAALGGLLAVQDVPGRRRKGSMSWGGLPNLKWWIDPEAKVCGFYACQLIPAADPKSLEIFSLFEKYVYSSVCA